MDICFQAFQGETTGKMVDVAIDVAPEPTLRIAPELTRSHLVYGDLIGLSTWFVLSMRSEAEGTHGDVDVAA